MQIGDFDIRTRLDPCFGYRATFECKPRNVPRAFRTENQAIAAAIKSLRAFLARNSKIAAQPQCYRKHQPVNAIHWTSSAIPVDGIRRMGHDFFYKTQVIRPGDWIVNDAVYSSDDFEKTFTFEET